jgi:tetratricopeptide (TPR) repeat protein
VANFFLGVFAYGVGDYRRGADHHRKNVESLQGDLVRERFGLSGLLSVLSRRGLVWCLAELGEFTEGLAYGDEALRIAESASQPVSLIVALTGLARIHLRQGEADRALPLLERALALCETWNIQFHFATVASGLASAYTRVGRNAEAQSLLEPIVTRWRMHAGSLVEADRPREIRHGANLTRIALGEAYMLAGRLDEAREVTQRAVALVRDLGLRGDQAWALQQLAEIAWRCEPPVVGEAESHYRQALTLAEPRGMRPLVAHCHLGLGKLYRRAGQQEAQEHLTIAATMYREMDMRFWLEKAETELKASFECTTRRMDAGDLTPRKEVEE